MDELVQRIIDLEIRSAEQQQTLDELSEMTARQWHLIDDLKNRFEAVRGRLLSLEERLPDSPDAPPPHY